MRGIAIPYAACDNPFRIKDLASINRYEITWIYHNLDLELKNKKYPLAMKIIFLIVLQESFYLNH